jgi:[acyl-carrier-protein] S-malonyltransferase
VDCVRTLKDAGCTTFIELGPGRVLSGLIRQIDPELEAVPADSPAALKQFAESR